MYGFGTTIGMENVFKKAINPLGPNGIEEWKVFQLPKRKVLVSNMGRVRTSRNDYCSINLTRWGYEQIWGKVIHQMVASLFVEKIDSDKSVVNHLDGIKTNNCFKNLEWTDAKGNSSHAKLMGKYFKTTGENHWTQKEPWRKKKGELNGRHKLLTHEVLEIRASDKTGPELAKQYNVTRTMISYIRKFKAWKHI